MNPKIDIFKHVGATYASPGRSMDRPDQKVTPTRRSSLIPDGEN